MAYYSKPKRLIDGEFDPTEDRDRLNGQDDSIQDITIQDYEEAAKEYIQLANFNRDQLKQINQTYLGDEIFSGDFMKDFGKDFNYTSSLGTADTINLTTGLPVPKYLPIAEQLLDGVSFALGTSGKGEEEVKKELTGYIPKIVAGMALPEILGGAIDAGGFLANTGVVTYLAGLAAAGLIGTMNRTGIKRKDLDRWKPMFEGNMNTAEVLKEKSDNLLDMRENLKEKGLEVPSAEDIIELVEEAAEAAEERRMNDIIRRQEEAEEARKIKAMTDAVRRQEIAARNTVPVGSTTGLPQPMHAIEGKNNSAVQGKSADEIEEAYYKNKAETEREKQEKIKEEAEKRKKKAREDKMRREREAALATVPTGSTTGKAVKMRERM